MHGNGNEYVPVQKRAGDQYQCNKRDKDSDYLQCIVSKLIIIMQNDIFSIILIHEDNKVYDGNEYPIIKHKHKHKK